MWFGCCKENRAKISDLEKDVNYIKTEQSSAFEVQNKMMNKIVEIETLVKENRKKEESHYEKTSDAILQLSDTVGALVTDNRAHRGLRQEMELESERKRARRDKIITGVATSLIVLATVWLVKILINVQEVNEVIKGS
ncbi:hypothetical protein TPMD03_44 [Thiohalocapsa phage LS06-2018-MD03]|nr:hypothetical protein TPMD03_44 [Thiohalocapsa phage LS06-2018-MD03]